MVRSSPTRSGSVIRGSFGGQIQVYSINKPRFLIVYLIHSRSCATYIARYKLHGRVEPGTISAEVGVLSFWKSVQVRDTVKVHRCVTKLCCKVDVTGLVGKGW